MVSVESHLSVSKECAKDAARDTTGKSPPFSQEQVGTDGCAAASVVARRPVCNRLDFRAEISYNARRGFDLSLA
jgi:hypothetical protein